MKIISFSGLNEISCTFRLLFSYHRAERIQTCVIDSAIDSHFHAIESETDDSVLSFALHKNPAAKFLPRHIGEKFSNLEEVTAYQSSLSVLRSYYFENMRRVQFIDASSNKIALIEPGSFKDLFSIKYLFLANNRIGTLDKDLFKNMVNLKNLDLAHNRIRLLDSSTFRIRGGKLLEANLLSNDCIDGNYEIKDFVRLGNDIRSNCQRM